MNFIDEQTILIGTTKVINYLPQKGIEAVRKEIITGLKAKHKYISPKYFYDKKGSVLFEDITQLDEYYPTRCEKEILSSIVKKLGVDYFELDIIELGSGDASKIKSIFKQISPDILSTINYFPVDISQSAIENSVHDITNKFDINNITGIVADFLHHHNYMPRRNNRLFCFLGSTIGNLSHDEVKSFIINLSKAMDKGDSLLLGADLIKDIKVIEAAYNDKKGITANFNKNILNVINKHLHANFNTADFEHHAFYNNKEQRIEMHLTATRNIQAIIGCTNEVIYLNKGESIHTENSCKFSTSRLCEIGQYGGLTIKDVFSDEKEWFSLIHYSK